MKKPYLTCVLELLLVLGSAYGIILPEHNCTDYFTYGIQDGKSYFGLFTAPEAGVRSIAWNITFGWQNSKQVPIASLDHYPSRTEAVQNMNSGRRVQLIARFRNINRELPRLLNLQINNKTLCSNPGVDNLVMYTRGISATKEIKEVHTSRPEVHPNFPTIAPKKKFREQSRSSRHF